MLAMQVAALHFAAIALEWVGLSFDLVNGKRLGHAYAGYALRKNFKAKTARSREPS